MDLHDIIELLKRYGPCPKCGCSTMGGGTGSVEADTATGYFKRTCRCGWSIEIKEETACNEKKAV